MRHRSHSRRDSAAILCALLLAAGNSRAASAQAVTTVPPVTGRAVRPDSEPGLPDVAIATRAAAVRMLAEPGGIVVVRVPIPPVIAAAPGVRRYSIRSREHVRVLTPLRGAVPRDRAAMAFSLSLGRRVGAGVTEMALVEFRADSTAVEVPVELDIPRVSQLSLQPLTTDAVAEPGHWTVLRLRVANGGNDRETITVHAMPVPGWRTRASEPLEVAPGGLSDVQLQLWVAPGAPAGLHVLRAVARRGATEIAETQLRVQVRPGRTTAADGLTMSLSSMAVNASRGTPATGYGLELAGKVSDSTTLQARGTFGRASEPLALFTLARSGLFSTPPSLSLLNPRFTVQAGVLSATLRDPGNAFLAGLGGAASVRLGAWRVGGFTGRPFGASSQWLRTGAGLLAGAGVERVLAGGSVGVQGVHLDDRRLGQGLQSFTLHGSELQVAGGVLDVSVAARRNARSLATTDIAGTDAPLAFDARPRLGGAATYRLTGRTTTAELRLLHTPGGVQSFARSGTEVGGSATRRLSRWVSAGGGGWLQRDDNQLVGTLRSTGWYVSPAISTPGGALRLGLDGRGSSFSLMRADVQYENQEQMAGVSTDARAGMVQLRGRSQFGSTSRRVSVNGLGGVPFDGMRQEHAGTLGLNGSRGTADVTWSMMGTLTGTALQPAQQSLLFRVDQLRLLAFGSEWITLSGEAQRQRFGSGFDARWTTSASLSLPLVAGLSVTASVDRNPFLSFGQGSTVPLVYALRIDQRRSIASLARHARATRTMYVDENRNQRRDRGETALAGVNLFCGSDATTTDVDGRFSCSRDDLRVDVRTLPLGIVPSADISARSGDVAVYRVQPVTVALQVPAIDAARLTPDELAKAVVVAKDAQGSRWFGRAIGTNQFVFDALPVGRYSLEVEQGDMREPLTTQSGANELWVTPEGSRTPHVVAVRGRQTRIRIIGAPADSTKGATSIPRSLPS